MKVLLMMFTHILYTHIYIYVSVKLCHSIYNIFLFYIHMYVREIKYTALVSGKTRNTFYLCVGLMLPTPAAHIVT